MKKQKKLVAVVFFALSAVFGLSAVVPSDRQKSGNNNKQGLKDTIFTEDIGKYMISRAAEKMPMREKWLKIDSSLRTHIGERIVNGVYIGEERLLDTGFSERKEISEAAECINSFASGYNGTLYIAAVPSSSGVYGDILPEYLLGDTENQQISRLYDSLGSNIRKIDAYNILKMLKDNYIYYRNDTKWTSYGAYCVYRTVIQKLGFQPTAYDKYTIRHVADNFRGSLYARTLASDTMADLIDIYEYPDGAQVISCMTANENGHIHECSFYDMDKLSSGDMYKMYLGEEAPVIEIETNVNNERRLLVIKDSYANCFIPFLTQHFNRITVVSPEYMEGPLSENIDVSEYEQTLMLFGVENTDRPELFSCIAY